MKPLTNPEVATPARLEARPVAGRRLGLVKITLIASFILALAGCASFYAPQVKPGTTATELRSRLGAPTDERRIGGDRAWDYVFGPIGHETYRYVFDSSDRVKSVEQLLSESRFRKITTGETTRDDMLSLYGRPMETMAFHRSNTEVWTYRYRDGSFEMLNDVTFAAGTGKVLYYALYLDPRVTASVDR